MEFRGLAFLPVLWFTWTLLGLYALAVLTIISGHERYPSISDMGKMLPESIVFKSVFIIISIQGAAITYVHYRFMVLRSEPSEKYYIVGQKIIYSIGCIMCIGIAVCAIFSLKTNYKVHLICAGLAFFFGAVYNLCQSACLYKRTFCSRITCHIRLTITLLSTVVLIIFTISISSHFFHLCSVRCIQIFTMTGRLAEWIGFLGLTICQFMNYIDFKHLILTLSRKGISISLREKALDPENPEQALGG